MANFDNIDLRVPLNKLVKAEHPPIHYRVDRDTFRLWTDTMDQYGQFEVFTSDDFDKFQACGKRLGITFQEHTD